MTGHLNSDTAGNQLITVFGQTEKRPRENMFQQLRYFHLIIEHDCPRHERPSQKIITLIYPQRNEFIMGQFIL